MKHVYLGILFVMNCFWSDFVAEVGNGKEVRVNGNQQEENVNDKCL